MRDKSAFTERSLEKIKGGDGHEVVLRSKANDKLYCIKTLMSAFDDIDSPAI